MSAFASDVRDAGPSLPGVPMLYTVLGLVLAVKIALAAGVPVTPDETLHWTQGRFLAWGYSDHPPGTAALSHWSTSVFGDNRIGIRFFAILATVLCSWIAWRILTEIGAGRRRALAGAVAVQLVPIVGFGVLMVPCAPHEVLVFAAEYCLLRALRGNRLRDHLLWGLLLGASLLTYYPAAVAVLAGGAFLAVDRRGRRAVLEPRLWLGGAVALGAVVPNVLWNMDRGTESAVHFQLAARHESGFNVLHPLAFMVLSVVLAGPLLLPALGRVGRCLRAGATEVGDWRPFFAAFLLVPLGVVAAMSLLGRTGAHWAVLAFLNVPLLLLAPRSPALAPAWIRSAVAYPAALSLGLLALLSLGLDRVVLATVSGAKLLEGERLLHMEDAALAADRQRAVLVQRGHRVRLAAGRWSVAGPLSLHTPGHPTFAVYPVPRRHGRDYRDWNPVAGGPVDLVYVAVEPRVDDEIRAASTSVDLLEVVRHCREFAWIYRCSGFQASTGPGGPAGPAHGPK